MYNRGKFGVVYKCQNLKTREECAIKFVLRRFAESDERGYINQQREVEIMKTVTHPNIIRTIEVVDDNPRYIYFVTEL